MILPPKLPGQGSGLKGLAEYLGFDEINEDQLQSILQLLGKSKIPSISATHHRRVVTKHLGITLKGSKKNLISSEGHKLNDVGYKRVALASLRFREGLYLLVRIKWMLEHCQSRTALGLKHILNEIIIEQKVFGGIQLKFDQDKIRLLIPDPTIFEFHVKALWSKGEVFSIDNIICLKALCKELGLDLFEKMK